jgi:hypothetical protein
MVRLYLFPNTIFCKTENVKYIKFKKMKSRMISFDKKNNTILSMDKLVELIKLLRLENIFSENDFISPECYILVDRNGKDFYPFPVGEIDEWEKDGSFERGDTLYKMNRLKTF